MKGKTPPRLVAGKVLEGLGMVIVLVGLCYGIEMGFKEEGLKSMSVELGGLLVGGGLFIVGYLLERPYRE